MGTVISHANLFPQAKVGHTCTTQNSDVEQESFLFELDHRINPKTPGTSHLVIDEKLLAIVKCKRTITFP